jgi:YfiH family protein
MKRVQNNGLPFYQFSHLAPFPDIQHAVFTRDGGESAGPFASLNTALSVGDDSEAVVKNRSRIKAAVGGGRLQLSRQVHGVNVAVFSGEGNGFKPGEVPEADAMITDIPGLNLIIQVADCQAVLLYDPVRRAVANIHSGWRSSVGNIIGETVAAMAARFGTDPADLLAGVGPSLGPCCAEFVNFREEIPESLWAYRTGDHHFDFWAMSRDQLMAAGVQGKHIQVGAICTRCRTDRFFSYRGEGRTGRFAVVIGLKKSP